MQPNLKIECHENYLIIMPLGAEGSAIDELLDDIADNNDGLSKCITPSLGVCSDKEIQDGDKASCQSYYLNLIGDKNRFFSAEILLKVQWLRPVYKNPTEGRLNLLLGKHYLEVLDQLSDTSKIVLYCEIPVPMRGVLRKEEAVQRISSTMNRNALLSTYSMKRVDDLLCIHRIGD